MTPTAIVAYLALFATVGFLFVLGSLLLGRLVRACEPTPAKVETYECGEPAVGPGSVQFDLRFYVVALVFLIFEVEVAFFFPPATVFGTFNRLREVEAVAEIGANADNGVRTILSERANSDSGVSSEKTVLTPFRRTADTVVLSSICDLGLFFAVLLVGFAYLWSRGDLDWVRAVKHPPMAAGTVGEPRGEVA